MRFMETMGCHSVRNEWFLLLLQVIFVYKGLKIVSCKAGDARDSSFPITLAADGCVSQTPPASFIIRSGFESGLITPGDRPSVSWVIAAFKFITSSSVQLSCIVRRCPGGDATCDEETTCPVGENKGRRKREVDENEAKVSGRLLIVGPYVDPQTNAMEGSDLSTTPTPPIEEECKLSRDFLVILITLSVATGLLIIVSLVLALKCIRINSMKKIEEYPPSM